MIDEDDANFDVFADELTDANHNVSIFHNIYIKTEVNPDCLKFKDAVMKNNHIENECWTNTLIDHDADTLMRQKKGKPAKNLTREKVIEIINKTEEEFKNNGASIREMEQVFKQFNIKARIYDINSKLIHRHDPENYFSKRVVTLIGLVKNSHIYTLNHKRESVKRKTKAEENHTLKNHSNYYINDRKEAMKYKMIDTLDDLLTLKKEDEYKLSLKDNDLNKFVFDLKGAGYEPQKRYGAGRISEIKMSLKFKKGKDDKPVVYSIESQDLDKDKIDEDIMVNTEDKYNRVSEEMFKFHRKSFNEAHKSYYNETDVTILDECRTIVANGRIYGAEDVSLDDRCSIDIRKAFTHSASQIVKIPVFREFDVYRPYGLKSDFNRLGDYPLYIVKACQGNIFFNKTFNLVYGLHLKKVDEERCQYENIVLQGAFLRS